MMPKKKRNTKCYNYEAYLWDGLKKICVRISENRPYSLQSLKHLSQFHTFGCLNVIQTASSFSVVHLPDASVSLVWLFPPTSISILPT